MANKIPELDRSAKSADTEVSAAATSIADPSVPLKFGPLNSGEVRPDAQGRCRPHDDTMPLRLAFAYRGIDYLAEVETAPEPQVRLTAELGKLPYSMEIGEGRHLIRRIISESARTPHGRIDLSENHDLRLLAVSTPPTPFTPTSLMATLAALLFDFRPYLELLGRVLDDARRATTADLAG